MGRRYYCDYCEKSFIDDLDARKKHLQSSNHIKLRHMHYEQCRDPETTLREELLKVSCRRFFQGSCPFEGICRYTHYSPEQLCELRQQVEQRQEMKRRMTEEHQLEIPSPELWIQNYNEKNNKKKDGASVNTFWTYPENLENRIDLPPSLIKFKPEHFFDDNFEEWGN